MPLILVRHGKTDFNTGQDSTEKLRGWLDVPLDEEGQEEATETAQVVSQYPISRIYSSDLQRTMTTAQAIAQATQAPVSTHEELRPWNLGVLQGQKLSDIQEVLDHLTSNPSQSAPQGESLQDFLNRFIPFFLTLQSQPGVNAAVTHFRNVVAVMGLLRGNGQIDPRWFTIKHPDLDPGEAFMVEGSRISPISDPDQGKDSERE